MISSTAVDISLRERIEPHLMAENIFSGLTVGLDDIMAAVMMNGVWLAAGTPKVYPGYYPSNEDIIDGKATRVGQMPILELKFSLNNLFDEIGRYDLKQFLTLNQIKAFDLGSSQLRLSARDIENIMSCYSDITGNQDTAFLLHFGIPNSTSRLYEKSKHPEKMIENKQLRRHLRLVYSDPIVALTFLHGWSDSYNLAINEETWLDNAGKHVTEPRILPGIFLNELDSYHALVMRYPSLLNDYQVLGDFVEANSERMNSATITPARLGGPLSPFVRGRFDKTGYPSYMDINTAVMLQRMLGWCGSASFEISELLRQTRIDDGSQREEIYDRRAGIIAHSKGVVAGMGSAKYVEPLYPRRSVYYLGLSGAINDPQPHWSAKRNEFNANNWALGENDKLASIIMDIVPVAMKIYKVGLADLIRGNIVKKLTEVVVEKLLPDMHASKEQIQSVVQNVIQSYDSLGALNAVARGGRNEPGFSKQTWHNLLEEKTLLIGVENDLLVDEEKSIFSIHPGVPYIILPARESEFVSPSHRYLSKRFTRYQPGGQGHFGAFMGVGLEDTVRLSRVMTLPASFFELFNRLLISYHEKMYTSDDDDIFYNLLLELPNQSRELALMTGIDQKQLISYFNNRYISNQDKFNREKVYESYLGNGGRDLQEGHGHGVSLIVMWTKDAMNGNKRSFGAYDLTRQLMSTIVGEDRNKLQKYIYLEEALSVVNEYGKYVHFNVPYDPIVVNYSQNT